VAAAAAAAAAAGRRRRRRRRARGARRRRRRRAAAAAAAAALTFLYLVQYPKGRKGVTLSWTPIGGVMFAGVGLIKTSCNGT
jgi:protein-S-isoprenylcysteine O-methyltransferase Ste14